MNDHNYVSICTYKQNFTTMSRRLGKVGAS